MAQTIKLKRSAVAGKIPATTDLALGELGINTTDGKLFLKKSTGGVESIVQLGVNESVDPILAALTFDSEPWVPVDAPSNAYITALDAADATSSYGFGKAGVRNGCVYASADATSGGIAPFFYKLNQDGSLAWAVQATTTSFGGLGPYATYVFADGSSVFSLMTGATFNRVYRFAADGTLIWCKYYPSTYFTHYGLCGDDATGDVYMTVSNTIGSVTGGGVLRIPLSGNAQVTYLSTSSNIYYVYGIAIRDGYIYLGGETREEADWQSTVSKHNLSDLSVVWARKITDSRYAVSAYAWDVQLDASDNLYIWNPDNKIVYSITQTGTLRYASDITGITNLALNFAVNSNGVALIGRIYDYSINQQVLLNSAGQGLVYFNSQSYSELETYPWACSGPYVVGFHIDDQYIYGNGYTRQTYSASSYYSAYQQKIPLRYLYGSEAVLQTSSYFVRAPWEPYPHAKTHYYGVSQIGAASGVVVDAASSITISTAPTITVSSPYTAAQLSDFSITFLPTTLSNWRKVINSAAGQ